MNAAFFFIKIMLHTYALTLITHIFEVDH